MAKRKRGSSLTVPNKRSRRAGRRPSAKLKAKRRKARTRRMTKQIKNVVKKEMLCSENTGTYTKVYTGEIDPFSVAGKYNIAFSMTRTQANADPYSVFNLMFKPFSRKKVLDAASTLYNAKTRSLQVDETGNFNLEGLKIETVYSSYDLAITNYTQFPYHVELWSITNKENQDRMPLDSIAKMELADEWIGAEPGYALNVPTQYTIDMGFELSMVKGLNSKFKHERLKKGLLYPGATLKHFMKQGAKCYDMTKDLFVTNDGAAVLPSHGKGETLLYLKYTPVMHMIANATKYVTTNGAQTGGASYGFLVEVKEVFKLFEPAETPDNLHGDKRALYIDVPLASATGAGPYTSRFLNTGPTFTDVTNPIN